MRFNPNFWAIGKPKVLDWLLGGTGVNSGSVLAYPNATVAFDFTRDYGQLNGSAYSVTAVPGWTFTRASTGYAETVAGTLTSFASGAPRITDRGLLVEEARTNLILQSQTLATTWTPSNLTVTSDTSAAPDATTTADTVTESTAVSTEFILSQTVTKAASSITYTISVYAKRASGSRDLYIRGDGGGGANSCTAVYTLAGAGGVSSVANNGTFTGAAGSIQALGGGWYRCVLTLTTGTETAIRPRLFLFNGSSTTYTGDGTSGLYIWGAQLEAGAFATSYIPTTTASATRAADVAALGSLSLLTGYSLYGEWFGEALPTSARVLDISGSVLIRRAGSSVSFNGAGRERSRTGGSGLCKAASAIGASDTEAALNGVTAGAASGTFSAVTVTTLTFASTGSSSYLNGYLRKALIYPTVYTIAELVALTA